MEKINTMGKTITGLSEEEISMIVRALDERSRLWIRKASETNNIDIEKHYFNISKKYRELSKLISEETK